MTAFDLTPDELPAALPLFPLPRVILLPRVQLPLNIFEPRYLAMTRRALAGDRLIGIIQQGFNTGCAGRIVSFSETEDGRYLITLKGVCRFNISKEMPMDEGGFRRAAPDWRPYAGDFTQDEPSGLCRDAMTQTLRAYFDRRGMICDKWREMKEMSCDKLISTLSVVCPFDTAEKQALLEAKTLPDRARLLQCLMENALREDAEKDPCCH
jgi:Lon protease-like protein